VVGGQNVGEIVSNNLSDRQRAIIQTAARNVPPGAMDRFEKRLGDLLRPLVDPIRDGDVSRLAYAAAKQSHPNHNKRITAE
jgi:hypothetical protein